MSPLFLCNTYMWKNVLTVIVAIGIGILVGWLCQGINPPQTEFITRTDTLTVRDTIIERHPVYVTLTKTDTMLVAVRDTVMVHDTAYVVVEREQRHYRGDDYEAWVSGYRPALDSIHVFPVTRYITTENIFVASRKCNSLALEASASWCGTASLLLSLEYTHEWRRWYAGASAGYDVVTGSPYVGARIGLPLWRW